MKSILLTLVLSAHILNTHPITVNAPGVINASENIPNCAINYEENTPIRANNIISLAADCNLPDFLTREVPRPTNELLCNKTYMDYRKITNRDTAQWKYIYIKEEG